MANFYPQITDEQADLIEQSRIFFVSSAAPTLQMPAEGPGPINLSPKGGVPLHILNRNKVAYLDYLGSGDETLHHSEAGSPVTIMVCSFDHENAAIVRLYGKARVSPLPDSPLAGMLVESQGRDMKAIMRQVIEVDVERTQTSCGYGVPVMDFVRNRQPADRGRRFKATR